MLVVLVMLAHYFGFPSGDIHLFCDPMTHKLNIVRLPCDSSVGYVPSSYSIYIPYFVDLVVLDAWTVGHQLPCSGFLGVPIGMDAFAGLAEPSLYSLCLAPSRGHELR